MKLIIRLKKFFFNPIITHLLFWSWNLMYLLVVLAGIINTDVLTSIFNDVISGDMPISVFIYCFLLFIMPIVSMIIAARYLLSDDTKILRWLVCIQFPVMFLLILRLSGFNELTWGNTHLIFVAMLGILTVLFYVLDEPRFLNPKWKELKLIGLTSVLLLVTYVCVLLLLVIFPLLVIFIKAFFSFVWLTDFFRWGSIGFEIIFGIFFVVSALLFVVYPFYAFSTYLLTFTKSFKKFRNENSQIAWVTVGLAVAVNVSLFFTLNYNQPQHYAFDLWEQMEQEKFPAKLKLETFDNEAKIKRGIMNAHLAKYRYAFDSDDKPLNTLYQDAFKSQVITDAAASAMSFLCLPFMYQGDMYSDESKARVLYGDLFDESLHIVEKDRIVNAMNSTWDRSGVEAGILDINEKKVWVKEQNVKINEHGSFASIEVHEVYQNQTYDQQEILYYFSLPDNAVFSGLWLSDNDSIVKKYDFNVAPRGAAQQVYKNELRKRIDPSLLEQVGPNQYRLRAFPILPKVRDYSVAGTSKVNDGPNFHLWIEYTTCIINGTRESVWPTPEVLERRNVFATNETKYSLNGKQAEEVNAGSWIPLKLIKTTKPTKVLEVSYEGKSVVFESDVPASLAPKTKLNVLIDHSYSMQKWHGSILEKLTELHTKFGKDNVKIIVGEKEIKSLNMLKREDFWGKNQAMEQLSKYADNRSPHSTVFITDNGSYELTTDNLPSLKLNAPIYIYHLGKIAKVYPDNLFETLKMNDGDVCTDLADLQQKIASKQVINGERISEDGGLKISYFESSKSMTMSPPSSMAAKIIGAKIIDNKIKEVYKGNRLQALDDMHRIALKHQIVSPYSSMIVLVTKVQKELLKNAENEKDRFDRENETGTEPIGNNDVLQVTGTPEPHEWVLIILSILMLLAYYFKQNQWKHFTRKT